MTSSDRDRPADQHDHTGHAFARREPTTAPPMRLADAVELVLVASAPRTARFDRDDLVIRKGHYALRNGHMTPRESMLEDLRAVGDALDEAGIGYLLVRGNDDRLVIAVDRADRKAIARALAEAFANEPFYSASIAPARAADAHPVLLADGRLSGHRKATILRLYRPRVEPVGRLRYGRETGVQLEFWRFGEDTIEAPVENALMRRSLPRPEAIDDTVHLHGRDWPTLEHMFAPLASDVDFDIDMVFSWVDGSSDEFVRERAKRMQSYVVGEGDDSEARYRQIDELKYALRSVYLFAPWVRRIFIATDSPAPSWLAKHPKVTIVRSEEMFADTSVLPTHNSHAVESQLHRIPGHRRALPLLQRRHVLRAAGSPSLFFSPGGITKFVEASTRIGLGETHPDRSGFENAARVNRALLRERFGKVTTRHLEHCAAPLRKSVMAELEAAFPEEFRRTAASPLPLGDRHLGHQLALPLLRAAHRSRGRADRRAGEVRRDHAPQGAARHEGAAEAPRPGHVLPQRRQLPRDLGRAAHRRRHRLPRALLPVPGAMGEGGGCRGRGAGRVAADSRPHRVGAAPPPHPPAPSPLAVESR